MIVGVIGLGRIGRPIAENLIRTGYSLLVHDVRREAGQELERHGATAMGSPREVAARANIMLTSLPHSRISEEVVMGPDGLLAGAEPGSVIVEISTVAPALVRKLAGAAADRGIEFIDAALSGGVGGAKRGTLTVMAGGSPEVFERVRPVLKAFAKEIFHAGPIGMGMTFKVVNNLVSHGNLAVLVEAVALGVAAGADPGLLSRVIGKSSGASRQLEERLKGRVLQGSFEPGMPVDLVLKDSELGFELGRACDFPLFIANAVHSMYELARRKGLGSLDYSSLIRLWEDWVGIKVREADERPDEAAHISLDK